MSILGTRPVSCFRQCQQQHLRKNYNGEMPSQNNVKTTLHPEIRLPAKQPVSSWVWNQCCTLSSAVPLSTSSQLLPLPRKGSEATRGFGPAAREGGRWHTHVEQDGSSSTPMAGAEVQQGPGQPAAPELLCQKSRSLCDGQGRQEHLDIHVVDKIAWSFLLGCQAKEGEETRRNWNVSTSFPTNN